MSQIFWLNNNLQSFWEKLQKMTIILQNKTSPKKCRHSQLDKFQLLLDVIAVRLHRGVNGALHPGQLSYWPRRVEIIRFILTWRPLLVVTPTEETFPRMWPDWRHDRNRRHVTFPTPPSSWRGVAIVLLLHTGLPRNVDDQKKRGDDDDKHGDEMWWYQELHDFKTLFGKQLLNTVNQQLIIFLTI